MHVICFLLTSFFALNIGCSPERNKVADQVPDKKMGQLPIGTKNFDPWPPRPDIEAFDPQKARDFLEWLKKEDPDRYKDLEALKDFDYPTFQRVLAQGVMHKEWMDKLQVTDPPRYRDLKRNNELEKNLRKLTKQCKQLSEKKDASAQKEIEQCKSEIKKILDELFNIKQREAYARVEEIKKKAVILDEFLKKREQNKDIIVKKKLDELAKGYDEALYDWDVSSLPIARLDQPSLPGPAGDPSGMGPGILPGPRSGQKNPSGVRPGGENVPGSPLPPGPPGQENVPGNVPGKVPQGTRPIMPSTP